jgi:hypothetical protein
MAFHDAIDAIVLLCSKGNAYIDEVRTPPNSNSNIV